jgi:fructose-1,6-bisphosphatase/inositol monophosphatase family enzyme
LTVTALDAAILDLLREVSRQVILPRYQALAAHEIEAKAAGDVVTVADHESEALLAEGLARIADIPVVGEEATHADPSVLDRLSGDCWIVDPLDGTRNFAGGRPPFGILVSAAEGGVARSGWIYDCLTERFCSAHHGQGAFVDGERIAARPTGETPPVAAISLIFMNPDRRKALAGHVAPHYRLVDVPYCAAEQYPRLALGVNDVSIFERTLAWDHAAGALWLNESGGRAARPDGSPYRVDQRDRKGLIGAASPALWDEIAARMAEIGPERA